LHEVPYSRIRWQQVILLLLADRWSACLLQDLADEVNELYILIVLHELTPVQFADELLKFTLDFLLLVLNGHVKSVEEYLGDG